MISSVLAAGITNRVEARDGHPTQCILYPRNTRIVTGQRLITLSTRLIDSMVIMVSKIPDC